MNYEVIYETFDVLYSSALDSTSHFLRRTTINNHDGGWRGVSRSYRRGNK